MERVAGDETAVRTPLEASEEERAGGRRRDPARGRRRMDTARTGVVSGRGGRGAGFRCREGALTDGSRPGVAARGSGRAAGRPEVTERRRGDPHQCVGLISPRV
ncbi:hypothetical protein GCM10010342_71090 [Streptomyces anulatus]|nr:hypothetical protein GCM10010342_71090 [Streptomyces anulatus]